MADNVEVLKKGYAAFGEGDIETASESWAEDIEWHGANADLPGGGDAKGKEDALKALQEAVGAWDSFELHIDEYIADGDTVVVLGHQHSEKGEESIQVPVVHVWRFEDGTPKVFQVLTDTREAGRALGL